MTYSTGLTKVNDTFLPMIESQLTGKGIDMDPYAKQCVLNALSSINSILDSKGISFNDDQLDRNNVTTILMQIAALKLNAAASPREVFFQLRNVKVKTPDNKEIWKKQIEMGIEGDGNDAILARFGRDVKEVRQFWLVREGDGFEYPTFNGLEMSPPKWTPKGQGEVVRIVYPIIRKNNIIEYHISERADVAKNLVAHINNGMMNETFGICADRYKANPDQKRQIAAKKSEILKRASELGIAALDDPDLQQWISPAWTEYHSRESMLIRKMRNNVVKKIPKDFGNGYLELIHSEATDSDYSAVRQEINEQANREVIDLEPAPLQESPNKPEASQPEPAQQEQELPPTEDPKQASLDDFSADMPDGSGGGDPW
ncbi:hypothetical protein [Paenibacillus daejeonensis]|uniref:hypothetical protein n=1 Tax=Paenibacillus daejeonensis TaxID=135193 RepID=UPI000382E47C|nr:hypothetical protein [Paenibacillus daejeonensis]